MIDKTNLKNAIRYLNEGEVICFPTDTVPGLACDPRQKEAVHRLYKLKGRNFNKPLVWMFSDSVDIEEFVNIPDFFRPALKIFWPGELTVIFPTKNEYPFDTLGIRIPDDAVLLELLKRWGQCLGVTSANISGEKDLKTIEQVNTVFGDRVSCYLSWEAKKKSIPSTIIDVSRGGIKLLRQGRITEKEIRDTLS